VPAAELNDVTAAIASLADTMKAHQGDIAWLKKHVGAAAANNLGVSDLMVRGRKQWRRVWQAADSSYTE
jgi:uncharacterized protein with LGFP repeats